MSRSIVAGLATHLGLSAHTLAKCCKIKRVDGTILGFTEHDRTLSVDLAGFLPGDADGAISYVPTDAIEFTAPRQAASLAGSGVEITGAVQDARITEEDIRAGLYDGAAITEFFVNWSNTAQLAIWFHGTLGETALEEEQFSIEAQSLAAKTSRVACNTIKRTCRADFGDSLCGVPRSAATWASTTAYDERQAGDAKIGDIVEPTTPNGYWYEATVGGTSGASEPTWPTTVGDTVTDGTVTWTCVRARELSGTVTAVTDRKSFAASGVSVAADHLEWGIVTWVTGDNAGDKRHVKSDDGSGALKFYRSTTYDIQASDTFTVTLGCRKRFTEDCVGRYDNGFNFRGFEAIPPERVD